MELVQKPWIMDTPPDTLGLLGCEVGVVLESCLAVTLQRTEGYLKKGATCGDTITKVVADVGMSHFCIGIDIIVEDFNT